MKILAVETSAKVASVALSKDGCILAEFTLNNKMTHSRVLMPLINELLKSLDFQISDIDLFAASNGPGSFTGLRIGVSTVKAFAYALNKPLVLVDTLEALSYNVYPNDKKVCALMDARNNQVFGAIFNPLNKRYVLEDERFAVDIKILLNTLKTKGEQIFFVGDAIELYEDLIKTKMGELARFPFRINALQRAALICYVAELYNEDKKFSDVYSSAPFYLRKSSAQQELEKKRAKS